MNERGQYIYMEIVTLDNIVYKGIVTMQFDNKKIIKHNSATKHMFNLLKNVIGRQTFDINTSPYYMMVVSPGESTDDYVVNNPYIDQHNVLLNTYIRVISEVSGNDYSVKFTGVLDNKMLISTPTKGNTYVLCLVDYNKENILACVNMNSADLVGLSTNSDSQIILNWTISLSNN